MLCAKCNSPMEKVKFNEVEVDRCVNCQGIWFDGLEHRKLKSMPGAEAVDTGAAEVGKAFNTMESVKCPVCGIVMDTVEDTWQRHIQYEVCSKGHGAFFDAGEFRDFKTETLWDFFRNLSLRRGRRDRPS